MTGDVSSLRSADFWRLAESFSLQLRRVTSRRIGGRRQAGHREAGIDFDGYQPYRAGDDIRHVDWSVYGRSRRLFVRRFRDDRSGVLVLLLDASGSMALGSPTKWVFARALGTVVALAALRELHQVVLGVIHDDGVQCLPNVHGLESGAHLVDFLNSVTPSGETNLDPAMQTILSSHRDAEVLVISDFLDPQGGQAGLSSVMGRRGAVQLVRVAAPGEFQLPPSGAFLADPERPRAPVRRIDQATRVRFESNLSTHRRQFDEAVARSGAMLMDVRTDGSFLETLGFVFGGLTMEHGSSG